MLDYDFVCCGNFGVLDFLIEAGSRGEPGLLDTARRRAMWLVARAERGGYRLERDPHEPGFFRGLAGIGHVLLRAIAPDRIASALAFAPKASAAAVCRDAPASKVPRYAASPSIN
jgi:lantibiotic modifying enzyme